MSSLIVEVCEIEERIDLEDCHSLDLYRVKGWYSISGKKLYAPGDKVVFIPPETEVTDKFCDYFCTGKVKIHKNRIKTEKIRGCISQGLLLDLRDSRLLEFYPELAQVSPGDDVANILEIRKWEPKNIPTNMKGKAVKRHPQLEKYTDIENIKNFNKVFQDEELVIVTEKLHGTSFHSGMLSKMKPTFFDRVKSFFGIKSSELCVSSRNTQVNFMTNKEKLFGDLGTKDNNVYSKTAEKLNLDVILEPGMILYGEIVGPGIQKNYHYGVKPGETEFYAYDLKVDGKFQPHQELEDFCRTHGIKTVPTLYIGPFSKEKIEELTSGDSMIGGQKVREGVVIRSISEQVDPKLGRKILKSINPKYLLKDQTEYH